MVGLGVLRDWLQPLKIRIHALQKRKLHIAYLVLKNYESDLELKDLREEKKAGSRIASQTNPEGNQ